MYTIHHKRRYQMKYTYLLSSIAKQLSNPNIFDVIYDMCEQ